MAMETEREKVKPRIPTAPTPEIEDPVDPPEDPETFRQQNQDDVPSPYTWFLKGSMMLLVTGLVVGALAYFFFF